MKERRTTRRDSGGRTKEQEGQKGNQKRMKDEEQWWTSTSQGSLSHEDVLWQSVCTAVKQHQCSVLQDGLIQIHPAGLLFHRRSKRGT